MKYVVIKTEVVTTTWVYEVKVDIRDYSYPNAEDRAISATADAQPVAERQERDLKFTALVVRPL